MPFAKGNKLWKDSHSSRSDNKKRMLEVLFGDLGEGGAEAYGDKMEQLALKKELTKPEQEFMDRYEKLLEYLAPKRAREDGQGNPDIGTKIFISEEHKEKAGEAITKFLDG